MFLKGVGNMSFSFDFNFLKNGAPIVTLSALGLAFNRGAIDILGVPERVIIGYDEKNHAIGVRACPPDTTAPCYDFASRIKNDWVRIGAKDFSKYLSRSAALTS